MQNDIKKAKDDQLQQGSDACEWDLQPTTTDDWRLTIDGWQLTNWLQSVGVVLDVPWRSAVGKMVIDDEIRGRRASDQENFLSCCTIRSQEANYGTVLSTRLIFRFFVLIISIYGFEGCRRQGRKILNKAGKNYSHRMWLLQMRYGLPSGVRLSAIHHVGYFPALLTYLPEVHTVSRACTK